MDEVCSFIKSVCDILMPKIGNSCEYIEFNYWENSNDWSNEQEAAYISSELQNHLGADVANIHYTRFDNRVVVMFTYKGFVGEVWETYNSRDYHFWVVSI